MTSRALLMERNEGAKMSALWIGIGVLAACATWWLMRRAGARPVVPAAGQTTVSLEPLPGSLAGPEGTTPVDTHPESVAPLDRGPMPESLAMLSLRRAERLTPERLQWFATALHEIPRPPSALQRLVSLDFIGKASSSELADLIMGEPLVATKVMSKVHSPIYGLREPVTRIGQAITFIGTTSVRNVCLRYLLDESFSSSNVHVKRVFETLAESSNLGSELSLRVAQRLQLPDSAALMTDVLLSFTGHLAATMLQVNTRRIESRSTPTSLLQRVYQQQQELGLAGSEIGRLLMREWNLPGALIDSVGAIDRVLVESVEVAPPEQAAHLALAYLCARLGERLADGRLDSFEDLDALLEDDVDFYHLRSYLALPALRGLRDVLRAPDLLAGMVARPQAVAA